MILISAKWLSHREQYKVFKIIFFCFSCTITFFTIDDNGLTGPTMATLPYYFSQFPQPIIVFIFYPIRLASVVTEM
jgi:hypothetical protein